MQATIKWLMKMENLAGTIYHKSAEYFADDLPFKKFLEKNAEEEAWHYHAMGSAAEHFRSIEKQAPPSVISIDEETDKKITEYFIAISEMIENNSLTKEVLLEKIIQAEISEWNDIFYYVVNYLKTNTREFIYPASRIQSHKKQIEEFIELTGHESDFIKQLKTVPDVWTESILIVDDEEVIRDLIEALLSPEGNIDKAANGEEALEQVGKNFYKLVISDIDMPEMDGISFFNKAVHKYPDLKNRFLFMTGDLSEEREMFFRKNGLLCLEKPFPIRVLRQEAQKILLAT